ncbi:MAG: TetR/AcrR family transcriptional regulator [Vicinamibacterales bacterium]
MRESTAVRPLRKPASRYHHGDLRRALLQEAVRTIARDGVDGLTLREVGSRLGVSRTALYRHFADKSALLAAVARDGFQRFSDDLRHAWQAHGESREGFEMMGKAYVRFAVSNPSHYRVMFGDYRSLCEREPALEAEAAASFQVLIDAIVTLQQAGLVRKDDPKALAQFIWAIVHGIAMLAINGQLGPGTGRHLDDVVAFALQRLRTGIDAPARARTR